MRQGNARLSTSVGLPADCSIGADAEIPLLRIGGGFGCWD